MERFTRDDLKSLLAEHAAPCVSVFLPTHRGGSEQDPIRWRKSLKEAEDRLTAADWRTADARELMAPGRQLLEDASFWRDQADGLAAFFSPHEMRIYRLPLAPAEQVVVGSRFCIKPLLPLLGGDGRFFILALSQNGVRLLDGTREQVTELSLRNVPRNLADAMRTHDRDEVLTYHAGFAGGGGPGGAIFHGQGVGVDDAKDNLLRYFQKIDRGLHPLLREEKVPLVLAAVGYLQPLYRQASTYPHLLEVGIEGNPDRLSNRELHARVWPLVQPLFEQAQQRARAQYQQLAGKEHTSSNLETVVAAAYAGRVATLFVALDRQVWGVFDPAAGRVEKHEQTLFGDVELLDFAAAHTLMHKGTVYAVEPGRVPSGTDLAAIFHLPLPSHGKRP